MRVLLTTTEREDIKSLLKTLKYELDHDRSTEAVGNVLLDLLILIGGFCRSCEGTGKNSTTHNKLCLYCNGTGDAT